MRAGKNYLLTVKTTAVRLSSRCIGICVGVIKAVSMWRGKPLQLAGLFVKADLRHIFDGAESVNFRIGQALLPNSLVTFKQKFAKICASALDVLMEHTAEITHSIRIKSFNTQIVSHTGNNISVQHYIKFAAKPLHLNTSKAFVKIVSTILGIGASINCGKDDGSGIVQFICSLSGSPVLTDINDFVNTYGLLLVKAIVSANPKLNNVFVVSCSCKTRFSADINSTSQLSIHDVDTTVKQSTRFIASPTRLRNTAFEDFVLKRFADFSNISFAQVARMEDL